MLQFFMLTKKNEIWHDSLCLDYSGNDKAQLWPCHKMGGNQKWIHKKVTDLIFLLLIHIQLDARKIPISEGQDKLRAVKTVYAAYIIIKTAF